jgi:nicotinate-nucleotide adenylyltransferase
MGTTHDYLERCDKLAVMGGTFDPIHNGHLAVAEAVLHKFSPRRVLFVPGGMPPHKPNVPVTCGEHRYKMTLASVCENPGFDVSRIEINRDGPSFTVETMAQLREICPPDAQIFFIIGADALMEILTWHGAEKLLTLCELIAVHRPGYEIEKSYVENLRKNYNAKIHIFEGPNLDISGTEIRERIAAQKPVSGLMPRAAENYARANGLYLQNSFEAVQSQIEKILSPRRFKHTLGTVTEAEKLAAHYGADVNKARWAALLHDCAKEFSADKKRELCKTWNIELDEILSADIDIVHSILGAESARRHYQICDDEIFQAIAFHTTGHGAMTLLDKIILLADFIEPYREGYPPLNEMRRLAYENINDALIVGMKFTIQELKQRGKPIHNRTHDALRDLKGGL